MISQTKQNANISIVNASGSARVDIKGFSSREIRANALKSQVVEQRRWLYEIEWSAMTYSETETPLDSPSVLFIGDVASIPAGYIVSRNASAKVTCVETNVMHTEVSKESNWQAVVFGAPLLRCAWRRRNELHTTAMALHVVQPLLNFSTPPSIWICTISTQPLQKYHNEDSPEMSCINAGLWGMSRAIRSEIPTVAISCIDVQRVAKLSSSPALVVNLGGIQLATGGWRGLQNVSSVELEAGLGRSGELVHVPRLVQPFSTQTEMSQLAFDRIRAKVDAFALDASQGYDIADITRAFGLLEYLSHQHAWAAINKLASNDIPLWYHRVLWTWLKLNVVEAKSLIESSEVCKAYEGLWPHVQLLEHVAPQVTDVLLGTKTAPDVLFPGGSNRIVLPYYENDVGTNFYNDCVVAAVTEIVTNLNTTMVILEVGAGTGGTASSVLPAVADVCERYIFTDVSELFLDQAKSRFAEYRFLEYSLLNIDADPRLQGYSSHSCDMIISTNCLHATPNIVNTITQCWELIKPGGVLVVNEGLGAAVQGNIIWGLTDGWWLYVESGDSERIGQGSPMLALRQWEAILCDAGFVRWHFMQGEGFLTGSTVMLAQADFHEQVDTPISGGHFITGGLGGLGLITARKLVVGGAREIALTSRSGKVVAGSERDWDWLSAHVHDIRSMRCDASEAVDVFKALLTLRADGVHLEGIFHLAHGFKDSSIKTQTAENFAFTFASKVHGGQTLHAGTDAAALRYFNLFGSIAGLLGSAFQAPHSTSSSWTPAMARFRRRLGLSGQAVEWGAVEEIGFAARAGAAERSEAAGGGAVKLSFAITALGAMLLPDSRTFAVMGIVWSKLLLGATVAFGLMAPYFHLRGRAAPAKAARASGIAAKPQDATVGNQLEVVLQIVADTAGGFVDADAPIMEAGVDSLGAVNLRSQLQSIMGEDTNLPSTVVFDHPTVRDLANFLAPEQETPAVMIDGHRPMLLDSTVRLACLQSALPGGVRGMSNAWHFVSTTSNAFMTSPAARWDSNGGAVSYGAFLRSIELFDNVTFAITAPEVATMDPQQRQLLELSYLALHGAGLPRNELKDSNTAVFVGVMAQEFGFVLPMYNAYAMTGTGHAFACGRLSYVLGLHGACVTIDVACSAALAACHSAHRAVQMHDTHDALVAGVNMMFVPSTLEGYAAAGLTSSLGKAFVFDSRAVCARAAHGAHNEFLTPLCISDHLMSTLLVRRAGLFVVRAAARSHFKLVRRI